MKNIFPLAEIALTTFSIRNILIVSLISGIHIFSYSQPNNAPEEPDYFEIYNGWQEYFALFPDETQGEEALIRSFNYWDIFWKGRVGTPESPGTFKEAENALLQLFDGEIDICTNDVEMETPWEFVGPDESILNTTWPYLGRVESIYVDYLNDSTLNTIYVGTDASGLWKTSNANDPVPDWECLTDNTSLPVLGVTDIYVLPGDADRMYITTAMTQIGTAGYSGNYGIGLLYTTDGGQTWERIDYTNTPVLPQDRINSFAIAFSQDANHGYVLTNGNLYRTDSTVENFDSIFVLPNASVTGGEGRFLYDFQLHPGNDSVLYLASYDNKPAFFELLADPLNPHPDNAGFYYSNDEGESWTEVDVYAGLPSGFGLPDSVQVGRIEIAVCPSDEHLIALTLIARDTGNSQLYLNYFMIGRFDVITHTIDWELNTKVKGFDINKAEVAISSNYAERFYVGGVNPFIVRKDTSGDYKNYSIDQTAFIHDDIRDYQCLSDGSGNDLLYAGHDGGISVCEIDSMGTFQWRNLNGEGLFITQFYGIDVSKNNKLIIGGTQDNHSYFRHIDTVGWRNSGSGDNYECLIDEDSEIIYGQSYGGGAASGASLRKCAIDSIPGSLGWVSANLTGAPLNKEMDTDRGTGIYIGINQSDSVPRGVYKRTPNTITSWDKIGTLTGTVKTIAVSKSNPDVIYAANESPIGEGGKFWKTIDAQSLSSATWTNITDSLENASVCGGISDIVISPFSEDEIWVCQGRFCEENRVHYSSDGGKSWVSVSAGLPPFPVDCLIFQEGTKGALYAGTDVGVFYNPDATDPESEWLCFNYGFPVCAVTDLEINYCENKIYAATFGRGIWMADLVPSQPLHITENTTWESNTTHYIDDLVIDPGVSLTIKGNVFISEMKTITVEKTARLYVTGGKLSNECGRMWQGIEIIGDVNEDQYPHNGEYLQGYVIFSDSAVMEHARQGFMTSGHYYDSIGNYVVDYTSTGGIIKAYQSVFRNNHRTAEILAYEYQDTGGLFLPNVCIFEQCDFIIDEDYRSTEPNDWHFPCFVSLYKVRGIRFLGCDFLDTRDTSLYEVNGGHGIWALNASFLVLPACETNSYPCEEYVRSRFTNLNHGVYSGLSQGAYSYSVDMADFTDNAYGVYSSAVNQPQIIRSLFDVGYKEQNKPTGIYIDTGTGYIIEENDFYSSGYEYQPGAHRPIGIRARNTGSEANTIYLNTFDELYAGNVAEGDNHNVDIPGSGLQYHCNENLSPGNRYDFYLGNGDRVARHQGAPEAIDLDGFAARNKFNLHNSPAFSDFRTIDTSWHYNYYFINPNTVEEPENFNSNLFNIFELNTNSNECESKIKKDDEEEERGVQRNFETPESAVQTLNDSIFSLLAQYNSLIDDGNTDSLLARIENATLTNALSLFSDLMSLSPWLSGEALVAIIDRGDIFSQGQTLEMLAANPDAALNDPVFSYIVLQASSTTAGMADSLEIASATTTARTVLEAHIALLLSDRDRIINGILLQYARDSVWSPDLVEARLREKGSLEAYCGLLELKLTTHSNVEALALLDSIPELFSLIVEQESAYQNYKDLKRLQINVYSDHRNDLQLHENEIAVVTSIADSDHGIAGSQARALLNFAYGGQYHIDPVFEEDVQVPQMMIAAPQPAQSSIPETRVTVYPNPANDVVVFEFELPGQIRESHIEVYDAFGKLLLEFSVAPDMKQYLWNITNKMPGLYIWKFYLDNKLLESDKILFVK